MGSLDGIPFDSATLRQASEAATSGLLGPALPPPAAPPAAAPPAGNPLAALLGGLGAALSPAGDQPANAPGLGARANAAVMNFLDGHGVLPAIAGAITGAATGRRTDPLGLMQAQQAATVRALVGAGITPDVAQAAAQHPDFMRLIAPQLVVALQRAGAPAQPAPTQVPPPDPRQSPSTGKTRQG